MIIYPTDPADMNAAERTLHLALRLLNGEQIGVSQAAREYRRSRPTVYRSIDAVCLFLPVDSDPKTGAWRLLTEAELESGE